MTKPSGIATFFKGIRFRSRLEATWAAFFDQLGWRWEYEPVDLQGYIPDFVLRMGAAGEIVILVEVKPDWTLHSLAERAAKIEQSGWTDDALLVGATPLHPTEQGIAAIGWYAIYHPDRDNPKGFYWAPAALGRCEACGDLDFARIAPNLAPWGVCCADHDPTNKARRRLLPLSPVEIERPWVAAKNAVQWRGPTR